MARIRAEMAKHRKKDNYKLVRRKRSETDGTPQKNGFKENPNGYLKMSFRKIADNIGISHSTVAKNIL